MSNTLERIKEIQNNMLGVTAIDGIAMVSSKYVAEIFSKNHQHVMEAIRNCQCSQQFSLSNFRPSKYKDTRGKYQPEYLLTKNGFAFVVMGFTGQKAARFKESYINRFDEMERFIQSRNLARLEYPELTDMIKLMHAEPKFYHFSNEADMINKIVLGMTAKQFREKHGLDKNAAIRDHMTPREADLIQRLQKVDVGLVVAIPDFQQRKAALMVYFEKLQYVPRLSA